MTTLFLDLASHEQRMCVVDDAAVLAERLITDHRDEGVLLKALDEALKAGEIARDQIGRIACVTGPGGFTTIRVGIAFANAMSYVLRVPICGIHLSDLWAARCMEQDFVWVHSTRKTQMFVRGFGAYKKEWPEAELVEMAGCELRAASFVGELLPEHEDVLQKKGWARTDTKPLVDILPSFLAAQTYDRSQLLPWYGRGI